MKIVKHKKSYRRRKGKRVKPHRQRYYRKIKKKARLFGRKKKKELGGLPKITSPKAKISDPEVDLVAKEIIKKGRRAFAKEHKKGLSAKPDPWAERKLKSMNLASEKLLQKTKPLIPQQIVDIGVLHGLSRRARRRGMKSMDDLEEDFLMEADM